MSVFKRERRKNIIFCDDMDCEFKRTCRDVNGLAGECCLDLQRAIRFYKKYGITTCEAGTGEAKINNSAYDTKRMISYYKNTKYKLKGSDSK